MGWMEKKERARVLNPCEFIYAKKFKRLLEKFCKFSIVKYRLMGNCSDSIEVPCTLTQFLPMATFYIIIVKYQNWNLTLTQYVYDSKPLYHV